MDLASLHLSLNHVPVIGVVFGFFILLVGAIARSTGATRTGYGLLILSAIVAIPVYLTGETAEEIVEKLPGFSEAITSRHESAAALSLGLVMFSGLLALAALMATLWRTAKIHNYAMIVTLLVSLVTTMSMVRTANLGGQIRHTEIRAGVQNGGQSSETGTKEKGVPKKDDDD